MSLGLFDVVGPVMHGPSSNHTAGANRIGYLARELMGGTPDCIRLGFHKAYMNSFAGQRTHSAMIAGLLGYREYEDESARAMELLEQRGVPWEAYPIPEENMSRNTFRAVCEMEDGIWEVNGDSIGGGNIVINRVNGLEVYLDGNRYELVITSCDKELFDQAIRFVEGIAKSSVRGKGQGKTWLFVGEFAEEPPAPQGRLHTELAAGKINWRVIPPLYKFNDKGEAPLFTTFRELLELSTKKPLIDVVLDYECQRSGANRQSVLDEASNIVMELEKSLCKGEAKPIKLIGHITDPGDGKTLMAWAKSGNAVVGEMFATALARAVILAQLNAAGEKVVAVPTGGSAGTLPGTLFTAAERYGKDRAVLAKSFLVAAAIGMIIGNAASYSGTVGGCQGEVGVGASMGAGGVAWMAGGTPEQVIHAAAIALKNVLGLTCDPPASPVEIPCVKRNAMGVSVAFMGAELGMAGIRSAIEPDDVVLALADTQRLMPMELKFSHCGGLASTPSGQAARAQWEKRLKELK